jgi:O-antigen/teichoic acid export membrane protein
LTQRIATTAASDNTARQATAFSSSLALSGLLVLAVAALLVVAHLSISDAQSQTTTDVDVRTAAFILGLATSAQVWLSVIEAAQLGHQEQYFANMFQAVGLASVLVVLIAAGSSLATVTAFVVATTCPPLVAKIANAVVYVARRPYLLTRQLSAREAAGVLGSSIAFAAVQLGSTASQQVGFLWLAYVAGPVATVPLGVMFRLNSAASSVVALVTQPLWPAVADAAVRHDWEWARRGYRRATLLTFLYAAAYALALMTVGSMLIRLWTGANVQVPQLMLLLFGLYFIVGVWAHVNAITLVGLGKVSVAARVVCLEAVVSAIGALLLVSQVGATGVILSLLMASAAVSATFMPLAVRRAWPRAARLADGLVATDGTASMPR